MSNRDVLERWFDELWTKRNSSIIDELVDPDCRTHGLPSALHGPSGFRLFYNLFGSAFRSVRIHIDEVIESGDRIAIRCTASVVTHDGKVFEVAGGGMARLREGRMIEAWNQWDFLTLLGAMGHVKGTAFVEAMQDEARRASR